MSYDINRNSACSSFIYQHIRFTYIQIYIYVYLPKFAQNNTFISGLSVDTLQKKYNGAASATLTIVQALQFKISKQLNASVDIYNITKKSFLIRFIFFNLEEYH